jgi:small-conductance mechanosensitive channel
MGSAAVLPHEGPMLIRRVRDRSALKSHRELLDLAAVVVFWAIVVLGAVIGFGTMGINVEALVAGLGLTGFALGFALKDMIANFLAGVLILAFRPFNYGDRIKVTGFEGDVILIDLRYTEIRDGANRHLIPNQTMYSSPVTICSRTEPVVAAEG